MIQNKISWKIGGEAGFGIMVTGNTMCRCLARAGFWAFGYPEYPSLIRGGHNTFQIDFSSEKVFAPGTKTDILIALNKETIKLHKDELNEKSILIYDPEDIDSKNLETYHGTSLPVPLLKLAKEAGGDVLMRNTVSLGATMAVLGLDFKILEKVLTDQFKRKGEEVVKQNVETAKKGYDFTLTIIKETPFKLHTEALSQPRLTMTLNEAIGIGAIAAGCKFFSSYPMTPINGLLAFMASQAEKYGFLYKQPEDEIAGINMAIGASFSGARAMTATSGGGFSLMAEAFGMAGMTERPLVVVMGQRPGPSSGLPTWTGQGDLQFMLNVSQGEFLRFVLAPGDLQEAFDLTVEAFNLADKYQSPVILLVDKYLCESYQATDAFNNEKVIIDRGKLLTREQLAGLTDYKRYEITEDGISPRSIPGTKGPFFEENSYEHDEYGFATEDAKIITGMINKRIRKSDLAEKEMQAPKLFGPEKAEYTFIGWGSTKAPVLEALKTLNENGDRANYLHFTHLSPLPSEQAWNIIKVLKKPILIEGNTTGQLGRLIMEKTGIRLQQRLLKYDGRPFWPEEIVEYLGNFT